MADDSDDSDDDYKLTGKASYITFSDDDGDNVDIPITGYGFNAMPFGKAPMLSTGYVAGSGMFVPLQYTTSVTTSAEVEGYYRVQTTPAQIISRLYSGAEVFTVYFGLDAGNVIGHGGFVIRNFRCGVPLQDICTFTCTLLGHALFYPGI